MLLFVTVDVIEDRPLRDRADRSADDPAHEHDQRRTEEDGLCAVTRVYADDDRGGETYKSETSCDHTCGDG